MWPISAGVLNFEVDDLLFPLEGDFSMCRCQKYLAQWSSVQNGNTLSVKKVEADGFICQEPLRFRNAKILDCMYEQKNLSYSTSEFQDLKNESAWFVSNCRIHK